MICYAHLGHSDDVRRLCLKLRVRRRPSSSARVSASPDCAAAADAAANAAADDDIALSNVVTDDGADVGADTLPGSWPISRGGDACSLPGARGSSCCCGSEMVNDEVDADASLSGHGAGRGSEGEILPSRRVATESCEDWFEIWSSNHPAVRGGSCRERLLGVADIGPARRDGWMLSAGRGGS